MTTKIQISWVTYMDPKSLCNVGTDVIAMKCHYVICFMNVKSKALSYYSSENAPNAGLQLFTGHNRFPFFAFVEAILTPTIHVMVYPDMKHFVSFPTRDVLSYIDLRFNEYGYIIALSSHPDYAFYVWNFRTGAFLCEVATNKFCNPNGFITSANNLSMIVQYSQWHLDMTVWELCLTSEQYTLQLKSKKKLNSDYELSQMFNMCFADDGNLYLINDYGDLHMYSFGEFYLKLMWASNMLRDKPLAHQLYNARGGLLILNSNALYFLRKKNREWSLEWMLEQSVNTIHKLVYNQNNEIYGVDKFGNISHLNVFMDTANWIEMTNDCFHVLNYAPLKGKPNDLAILLLFNGELRLVDLLNGQLVSSHFIADSKHILAHSSKPFVIVGTSMGELHFLSYALSVLSPSIINTIQLQTTSLTKMAYNQNTLIAFDADHTFHIIKVDFMEQSFIYAGCISSIDQPQFNVLDMHVVDDQSVIIFGTQETSPHVPHADELRLILLNLNEVKLVCKIYKLPSKYRMFNCIEGAEKDSIEIFAVRLHSKIFDIFMLGKDNKPKWTTSIKTLHLNSLNGLSGYLNIITWGLHSLQIHYRTDKNSPLLYAITKEIRRVFTPREIKRMDQVCGNKYILVLYHSGIMRQFKIPALGDSIRSNEIVGIKPSYLILKTTQNIPFKRHIILEIERVTDEHYEQRAKLAVQLSLLSKETAELIDYDISVTGKTHGIFSKFCLNFKWLKMLQNEAKVLCDLERKSMEAAAKDQARIRDWILECIYRETSSFSCKLRAIFSCAMFENFSVSSSAEKIQQEFDLYRLYDMEPYEEDLPALLEENEGTTQKLLLSKQAKEVCKPYVIQGNSVYDYVMSAAFSMQNENVATLHQMRNEMVKFRLILANALQLEFNQKFAELQQIKQETITNIANTNATMEQIYGNMNIMLRLLRLHQFKPPQLISPDWSSDEMLERILTVDDSEIKAINRRKKKDVVAPYISGRLLLWPPEFWERTLLLMMDGVLEKLWEEEIKKDIPLPLFYFKKDPSQYTLEEQRAWLEYEEKVRLLQLDRRKYLHILRRNEKMTKLLKKNYILKMNEKVAQMARLKLKYDYAIRHNRLRLFNLQLRQVSRMQIREQVRTAKNDLVSIRDYVDKYEAMSLFWDKSVSDIKTRLDTLNIRDKAMERSFRLTFINMVPSHLSHEMMKLYKRRPKQSKSFNNSLIYFELASQIATKASVGHQTFPLPQDAMDFMQQLNQLDEQRNCPHQIDAKLWENFVRLRRLKVENELKIKGTQCQLHDANASAVTFKRDMHSLQTVQDNVKYDLAAVVEAYRSNILNPYLQITLTMGQVEIRVDGALDNFEDYILMNANDLKEINDHIKAVGAKKIQMMERVALFRRKVIYKEWEHKVTCANIEYLTYMLEVISKCKVTHEFLQLLRNWKRVKADRDKMISAGYIENVLRLKIEGFRKNLEYINEKIARTREQIEGMKYQNHKINKTIEMLKVDVAFTSVYRDDMIEQNLSRQKQMRMDKIATHRRLVEKVRANHMHIMELTTILELQRLRTYPTLGPAPAQYDDYCS